jgi:hypothetical protein
MVFHIKQPIKWQNLFKKQRRLVSVLGTALQLISLEKDGRMINPLMGICTKSLRATGVVLQTAPMIEIFHN